MSRYFKNKLGIVLCIVYLDTAHSLLWAGNSQNICLKFKFFGDGNKAHNIIISMNSYC